MRAYIPRHFLLNKGGGEDVPTAGSWQPFCACLGLFLGGTGELESSKIGGDPVLRPSRSSGHSTAGLRVAPGHLTRSRIAAHSSPGLEAEESTHSIGNHHQASKKRGSRALVIRPGALQGRQIDR